MVLSLHTCPITRPSVARFSKPMGMQEIQTSFILDTDYVIPSPDRRPNPLRWGYVRLRLMVLDNRKHLLASRVGEPQRNR